MLTTESARPGRARSGRMIELTDITKRYIMGDVIVDAPHPGVGRSKYDDFTVLLFFGFSSSDVDKRGN